jgi:hypothetical protein
LEYVANAMNRQAKAISKSDRLTRIGLSAGSADIPVCGFTGLSSPVFLGGIPGGGNHEPAATVREHGGEGNEFTRMDSVILCSGDR